jgi:hypothetical protein
MNESSKVFRRNSPAHWNGNRSGRAGGFPQSAGNQSEQIVFPNVHLGRFAFGNECGNRLDLGGGTVAEGSGKSRPCGTQRQSMIGVATKYLMTSIAVLIFLFGSRGDLFAYQTIIIKAVFLSGTDQFADSAMTYGLIEEVGNNYRDHYLLDSMVISVMTYRCSDEEPDDLWSRRLNKFLRVVYEVHPDFKSMVKKIYHSTWKRPYLEAYLKEGEEIGLIFGLVFKDVMRRGSS